MSVWLFSIFNAMRPENQRFSTRMNCFLVVPDFFLSLTFSLTQSISLTHYLSCFTVSDRFTLTFSSIRPSTAYHPIFSFFFVAFDERYILERKKEKVREEEKESEGEKKREIELENWGSKNNEKETVNSKGREELLVNVSRVIKGSQVLVTMFPLLFFFPSQFLHFSPSLILILPFPHSILKTILFIRSFIGILPSLRPSFPIQTTILDTKHYPILSPLLLLFILLFFFLFFSLSLYSSPSFFISWLFNLETRGWRIATIMMGKLKERERELIIVKSLHSLMIILVVKTLGSVSSSSN